MKYLNILIASAVAVSAQVTYNSTTGVYTCPKEHENGAFCAGDSLKTNIIIRCTAGVGQPGNCNDNLVGQPPVGVNFAPCYETSPTAGDAACSKNCIIYGASGGTSKVPDCTPSGSSTSSSTQTTSSEHSKSTEHSKTTDYHNSTTTAATTKYSTVTSETVINGNTKTTVYTTICPTSEKTIHTTPIYPTKTHSIPIHSNKTTIVTSIQTEASVTVHGGTTIVNGGSTIVSQGSTIVEGGTTVVTGGTTETLPAGATPVGPAATTTGTSEFTGAANANLAGLAIAGIGFIAAFFF